MNDVQYYQCEICKMTFTKWEEFELHECGDGDAVVDEKSNGK